MIPSRRLRCLTYIIVAAALAGAFVTWLLMKAHAEPPESADQTLAPWFHSLHSPSTGVSCCSEADCRAVVVTHNRGKLYAFIGEQFRDSPMNWVEVPDAAVLRGKENPTGEPVLCWFGGKILCFVNASQG